MNFNFFAFASKASTGEFTRKLYTGIASCKVLAVNPSKKELEDIYKTTRDNEPNYLGVNKDSNCPTARIDFILKTIPEKCGGIDTLGTVSFFLEKNKIVGSQSGKIQVIDKYGQDAWATSEDIANHKIPQYANGPANIDVYYRPAYVGEIQLIAFLKAYLGVANTRYYKDGQWYTNANLADCEASLTDIDKYFTGDFTELKELINIQPNNAVRTLWGVRDKDGKQYQTVYNEHFQKAGSTTSTSFEKHVSSRKSVGAYATTEFDFNTLHEYSVTPTAVDDLPEAVNPADNFFND